jgi:hypothetical protein
MLVDLLPELQRCLWTQRFARALFHGKPDGIVNACGCNLDMVRGDLLEVSTLALDVVFLVVGGHRERGQLARGGKPKGDWSLLKLKYVILLSEVCQVWFAKIEA